MAEPALAPGPPDSRLADDGVRSRLERIDDLLERVEQVPGPTSDAALEAVQLLTEIYGEALSRAFDAGGAQVVRLCAGDELLRHLMVLHEIHPDSVEERAQQVIDEINGRVEPQGVRVELAGVDHGVARVRVTGGGAGCGSRASANEVDEALIQSVLALAPELSRVEAQHESGSDGAQALIPVEALLRRTAAGDGGR